MMWKKKEEGAFKPLWVRCRNCQKWNSVQPGAVLKYLDKLLSPAPAKPPEEPQQEVEDDDLPF